MQDDTEEVLAGTLRDLRPENTSPAWDRLFANQQIIGLARAGYAVVKVEFTEEMERWGAEIGMTPLMWKSMIRTATKEEHQ